MELSTKLHQAAFASLDFDIDYYQEICRGKRSLEICAGFGRVSNRLHQAGIDITALEISKTNCARILLPNDKIICRDLMTVTDELGLGKFDTIIAPFNSIPIFESSVKANTFFRVLRSLLAPGGMASISYYHPEGWAEVNVNDYIVNVDGKDYVYTCSHDLSKRAEKIGYWTDRFSSVESGQVVDEIEYTLRIYEDVNDINQFAEPNGLHCEEMIDDFYNPDSLEPGWKEFVVRG